MVCSAMVCQVGTTWALHANIQPLWQGPTVTDKSDTESTHNATSTRQPTGVRTVSRHADPVSLLNPRTVSVAVARVTEARNTARKQLYSSLLQSLGNRKRPTRLQHQHQHAMEHTSAAVKYIRRPHPPAMFAGPHSPAETTLHIADSLAPFHGWSPTLQTTTPDHPPPLRGVPTVAHTQTRPTDAMWFELAQCLKHPVPEQALHSCWRCSKYQYLL